MDADCNPRVVICRSNPVDPDPRVEKTAFSLSQSGYSVAILGWDRTGHKPQHEILDKIDCYRLLIPAEYGTGLGNLSALLRWQWGLLKWLITQRHKYDLIHACDFDTILPALAVKFLWGKKVIYDIFDFYADHLRSTPAWIKKAIRCLDRKCIQWADGVIVVDEARWAQISGARSSTRAVIYNTPLDVRGNLSAERNKSPEYELTLVYVGLLQKERGIFEILQILAHHPAWSLDLAGFGGDEDEIIQLAAQLPNVFWHGRVPYSRALQLSHSADIIFATYDPAIPNHRYASPNKVFEALMLGKPLIVARGTHIDQMVSQLNCGLVIPYGDVIALEAALTTLNGDNELRSQMGANARRAYEQSYQWSRMEARLIDLYTTVRDGPANR